MPTTILFDNCDNDNLTVPALPTTGWSSFSSGFATSTAVARSGTKSLQYQSPGSSGLAQSAATDGDAGNAQIKASFYFSGLVREVSASVVLRSDAGVNNGYYVNVEPAGSIVAGVTLFKNVGGVASQLGSTVGASAFTTGQWYTVQLVANGTSLKVYIQRVQDKAWLSTAGLWAQPAFGAGPPACITVSDASVSAAGYGQLAPYQDARETAPLYIDDVIFENLATSEPLWQRVPRHRGGRPALKAKIRVKRRPLKELLHHVRRPPIATPTYINSATANNAGSGTALTIQTPDGITAGDLLVAFITWDNNPNNTITPPAGWTLIRQDNSGGNLALAGYSRVVDGTETQNYQWTFAFNCRAAGIISDYAGVDPANPIEAAAGSGGLTTPTVTSTNDYSLLCCVYSDQQGGDSPWTPDANETDRAEDGTTFGVPGVSIMQSDETLGPAGSTGTRTAVPNQAPTAFTLSQAIVLGAPPQMADFSWYRRFSRPRQHKPPAARYRRKRRGLATIAPPPAPTDVPNYRRPKRRFRGRPVRVKRRSLLPALLAMPAGFDAELYHPARPRRSAARRPRVKRRFGVELLPAPPPAFAAPTWRRARRQSLRAKIFRKKKFPVYLLPAGPPAFDLPNNKKPRRRFQRRPIRVKRRRPDALLPWMQQQYFYECFWRPARRRRPARPRPHVKRRVPQEILPYTEPDFLSRATGRRRRPPRAFLRVKDRFPVEVLPQPFDPLGRGPLDRKRRPGRRRPRVRRRLPLDALFPPMMADFIFWPHRGRRRPARWRPQRHRRGLTALITTPAAPLDADLFRRRKRGQRARARPRHRPWPQLLPAPAVVASTFDVTLFRRPVKRRPTRWRRQARPRPLYLYAQPGSVEADLFRRRRRARRPTPRRQVRPWAPLFPPPGFDADLFRRRRSRRRLRVRVKQRPWVVLVPPASSIAEALYRRARRRPARRPLRPRRRPPVSLLPAAASVFWPEGLYRRARRRPAPRRPRVRRKPWAHLLPQRPLGFNDQPFRRTFRRSARPGRSRRRPRSWWFAGIAPARFDTALYRRRRQIRARFLRHRPWRTGWHALPAAPAQPPAITVIPVAPAREEYLDLLRPREFAALYRGREYLAALRSTEWIMGVQQTREKWAAEIRDYWFNFSPQQEIVNGDTLAAPVLLTYDVGILVYADSALATLIPSGTAPPASTLNATTNKLTFWVKGGTSGQSYNLDCQVKTTGGRLLEEKGILKVN